MQLLCLRNQKRTIIFHLERERMSFAAKNKLFPGQKCVFFCFRNNTLTITYLNIIFSGHERFPATSTFWVTGQKDYQFPVTGKVHMSFPVGFVHTEYLFPVAGIQPVPFSGFSLRWCRRRTGLAASALNTDSTRAGC